VKKTHLFVLAAVVLLSSMGIGILVATFVQTLQQALLTSFFALFPILFLSGTLVPVESMPAGLQVLAQASPLTHYMKAVLGIFLKGVTRCPVAASRGPGHDRRAAARGKLLAAEAAHGMKLSKEQEPWKPEIRSAAC